MESQNNLIETKIPKLNFNISNKNKPEDKIYDVAINSEILDWKSLLYDLIYKEGLNPWDIDLSILTKKYLIALKDLKEIDFNISGKFLTVAIYLLKTKSEKLLENDLKGFEDEINNIQNLEQEDEINFDEDSIDNFNLLKEPKKKEYKLKFRNPIARKRKVNIFDLISTLEKTFKQSNKRRTNNLLRELDLNIDYEGPTYEKKTKDLKEIIEDIYNEIYSIFNSKKTSNSILFSDLISKKNDKLEIIDKFIPVLHLQNQSKIKIKQIKHFDKIKIYLNSEDEDEEINKEEE